MKFGKLLQLQKSRFLCGKSGALVMADQIISRGWRKTHNVKFLVWREIRRTMCSSLLSNFPILEEGFNQISVFENFHYLLRIRKNVEVLLEIRRNFPWILWIVWRNRNTFVIKGKSYEPNITMEKISEDVHQWLKKYRIRKIRKSTLIWTIWWRDGVLPLMNG